MSDNDKKRLIEIFLMGYVILNGVATGMLIQYFSKMQSVGHDNPSLNAATILTAGAWMYTAHRIRQVWHDRQNMK